MSDIYKNIDELLQERGISGAKLCTDLGMSRSFMTELRKDRIKSIRMETAQKIAAYLDVPVVRLLGENKNGPSPAGGSRTVSDEDIKFALFGGDGEITDEMYAEVKRFAAYLKEKRKE